MLPRQPGVRAGMDVPVQLPVGFGVTTVKVGVLVRGNPPRRFLAVGMIMRVRVQCGRVHFMANACHSGRARSLHSGRDDNSLPPVEG